jgi:hypothetical protein
MSPLTEQILAKIECDNPIAAADQWKCDASVTAPQVEDAGGWREPFRKLRDDLGIPIRRGAFG